MMPHDDSANGPAAPLYTLEGVSFSAGSRMIIAGMTLSIAPGRIYGLVGPNGSGKSTLIRMLARQLDPAAGRLSFMGREIRDWSAAEFARSVAYMPQFTPPAEGLTVAELVALGRFPWHGALGRFTLRDRQKVDEALADTGLAAFRDRLVDRLSGGERQRVWLAMMLAQDTSCLLLDEPTSALDVAHQAEMLALVRRLSRSRGLGAVVVLHDINMAAMICDEILALRDGELMARGTPETIMNTAVLEELYGIRMGIFPHPQTGRPIGYVE